MIMMTIVLHYLHYAGVYRAGIRWKKLDSNIRPRKYSYIGIIFRILEFESELEEIDCFKVKKITFFDFNRNFYLNQYF